MSDRKDECQQALDIYRSLADHSERAAFLKDFESNGAGKTPGALKFALRYTKELKSTKETGGSSGGLDHKASPIIVKHVCEM